MSIMSITLVTMQSVPFDIIRLLLRIMDIPSLGCFIQCCKSFHALSNETSLWEERLFQDNSPETIKLMKEEAYPKGLPNAKELYKDLYVYNSVPNSEKIKVFSETRNYPAFVLFLNYPHYDHRYEILLAMKSSLEIASYALKKFPLTITFARDLGHRERYLRYALENHNVPVLGLLVSHGVGIHSAAFNCLSGCTNYDTFALMAGFLANNCLKKAIYDAYQLYGYAELESFLTNKQLSTAYKQYIINETARHEEKVIKLTAQDQADLLVKLLNRYNLEGAKTVAECLAKKMKRVSIDTEPILVAANQEDKLALVLKFLSFPPETLSSYACCCIVQNKIKMAKMVILAGRC